MNLDLPSFSMDIAAALEAPWSSFDWSAWATSDLTTLDQLQSHHSSGNEMGSQTPQSHFVDDKQTILSRKRPLSRLSSTIPRFSSRLGFDSTLDDDAMASRTMSGQTYKFGTGLGPARSETMKDQSNVASPDRPSKPPMSPHTDAGSSVSTTPSKGLPGRPIKIPRNVTSLKRASSDVRQERSSMIPTYQLRRPNFAPPSSPRSDAAIPRHNWSRENSESPMAAKYRRTISTRRGEPSGGDLSAPGSSNGKHRDLTGGGKEGKHLAVGKGN